MHPFTIARCLLFISYDNASTLTRLGLVFTYFLIITVLLIFYYLTLQNTLKSIAPENRTMQPAMIWLQCIPLFGNIWQFFVVIAIAQSLTNEFKSRQSVSFDPRSDISQLLTKKFKSREIEGFDKSILGIGIAMSSLFCLYVALIFIWIFLVLILGNFAGISFVFLFFMFITGIAKLLTWIIYWVKVNTAKNRIQSLPPKLPEGYNKSKYFTT